MLGLLCLLDIINNDGMALIRINIRDIELIYIFVYLFTNSYIWKSPWDVDHIYYIGKGFKKFKVSPTKQFCVYLTEFKQAKLEDVYKIECCTKENKDDDAENEEDEDDEDAEGDERKKIDRGARNMDKDKTPFAKFKNLLEKKIHTINTEFIDNESYVKYFIDNIKK